MQYCLHKNLHILVYVEYIKSRGLCGNVSWVGPWVRWLRGTNFFCGLGDLRWSKYFLYGSTCYVGYNFYVGREGVKHFCIGQSFLHGSKFFCPGQKYLRYI